MRMLKAAVVVMGVLIIAGVGTLVVLLTQRVGGIGGVTADSRLDEPEGTRIAGVSVQADRLALQLQGGGPDRVVVLDLRSGRVVAQAGLAR